MALPQATATLTVPVAAIVNGEYVSLAEVEVSAAQYEAALVEQGLDRDSEQGRARLQQLRFDVLDGLIDLLLIEQAARDMGLSLSDEDLDAQILADIEAGGGESSFSEWLSSTGQTREDYREMVRQSLITQRVMDRVAGELPEEVEQVRLRDIVQETEEAARLVVERLQGGADFASLAREASLDPTTREAGGDLGWVPRGVLAIELEEVAFRLEPGERSDVVRVGSGYHVIQVVERESARRLAPEIRMSLVLGLFDQWLAERRAEAAIERFLEP